MPTIYQPGQRIDHYKIIRLLGRGGRAVSTLPRINACCKRSCSSFPMTM
jgi:hypothetical protein